MTEYPNKLSQFWQELRAQYDHNHSLLLEEVDQALAKW